MELRLHCKKKDKWQERFQSFLCGNFVQIDTHVNARIYIINLSDGVNVVNYLRLQLFVFAPTSKQLMYTINIQIITRLIAAEF